MILEKGNMWSIFPATHIFMITTNPVIKNNGGVVMGRGIAKQAKDRWKRLPFVFGKNLQKSGYRNIGRIGDFNGTSIWWFMVKSHWAENAKLDIIQASTDMLDENFGNGIEKELRLRVDLNFPGIGNGGLEREAVLPILQKLPDNIHIWEM